MSDLIATIARIAANTTLLTSSEEATRQAAILPVLAELGWPWHNIDEVVPEYSAGSGRVDYCLRTHGRATVFIEVKRAGTDLSPHQEQLLRYAFEEGVPLAVLTDGLVWWLYVPTATGSWEQRRFFSVDTRRVPSERSAEVLERFLGRTAVVSGEASERALAEFTGQERQRRITEAFPTAWRQLVEGPDELLAELLAEAVAGIAGHSPDPEQVARFLVGMVQPAPPATSTPSRRATPPTLPAQVQPATAGRTNDAFTGTTPRSVTLAGREHSVSTWRDVLLVVCRTLASSHHEFVARVLPLRGRKRTYFSRTPEELIGPLPIEGTGIYVEGNLSANSIVKLSRTVLTQVEGSDAGFSVEVATDVAIRKRRSPARRS